LLIQVVWRAFSRAWANTGKRIAASIAIIAITTSNSIRVKALHLSRVKVLAEPERDIAGRAGRLVLSAAKEETGSVNAIMGFLSSKTFARKARDERCGIDAKAY
jgi:hypothetical protein